MTRYGKQILSTLTLFGIILASGCYYDNEEYLYPVVNNPSGCDTASVSYSAALMPVLQQQCLGCHTGAAAGGGVNLATHAGLTANITRVIGSINHAPGFSPMPQGGNKLPACTIRKFEAWRNQGMLNN